jgi:hypothetical protein
MAATIRLPAIDAWSHGQRRLRLDRPSRLPRFIEVQHHPMTVVTRTIEDQPGWSSNARDQDRTASTNVSRNFISGFDGQSHLPRTPGQPIEQQRKSRLHCNQTCPRNG